MEKKGKVEKPSKEKASTFLNIQPLPKPNKPCQKTEEEAVRKDDASPSKWSLSNPTLQPLPKPTASCSKKRESDDSTTQECPTLPNISCEPIPEKALSKYRG
jgi:hypothetical protein